MKVLEYLFVQLEVDHYPYRPLIIAVWVTFTIAAIVGYFAFVK